MLQFFIARQPDDSHSALSENLDQHVATENFLTSCILTQSRIDDSARVMISHARNVNNYRDRNKV